MNKKIIEKYNMFTNVDAVFTSNMSAIDTVSALKAQVVNFQTGYAALSGPMEQLQLTSTGTTKAKQAAKQALAAVGGRLCGAMKACANDSKDPALFAKANYSPSALFNQRDLVLAKTGQALYDLANGLAPQLLAYGIKAAELDAMNAAVDKFKLLNPQVRAVKVDNKTLRSELFGQVEALDLLLRSTLDNAMMVMEFSYESFYSLYRNARRNYSDGVRHRKPEAAATPTINASEAPDLSVALQGIMSQPQENGVLA
jgi:hypothetical protein